MSKRVILTQKQLDEIVGCNTAYLDNIGSDFNEFDGANYVYTGDKTENGDAKPLTTDKLAKQMRRDSSFYGLNRNISVQTPIYVETKKSDWENKIFEDNQNLVNRTYGDNKNRVSNTNASTLKWRYGAAKKKAQSSDPTIKQQGISTMKTMEKNNPNLKQIEAQYNNAMANDANIKRSQFNRGEQNVYQKSGGSKNDLNPTKQVITYESIVKEGKSINSKKLLNILQKHGGIEKQTPWLHKNYPMTNADLHNISDENVIGVVDYSDLERVRKDIRQNKQYGFVPGDDIDYVKLGDGKFVLLLVKNANYYKDRMNEPNTFKDLFDKKQERDKNKPFKGKHNDFYRWRSKDAQDLAFNNPYYSKWSNDAKQQLRDKIKDDYKK